MTRLLRNVFSKILFFVPDTLVANFCFEVASYVGRLFSKPLTLNANENYVNLGSGPNIVRGCINIDFFMTQGIDYGADLRYPLKIIDDSIDGIFCEHTLEHLFYRQADRLIKECYRVLKPGAYIRIVLPDLSLFIKNYHENNGEWFKQWEVLMFKNSRDAERQKRKLNTPLEAISFVTQEYGHVSSWDFETLNYHLKKNRFVEIKKTGFMKGSEKNLLIDFDDEDRKFVSLYVEARKADGCTP